MKRDRCGNFYFSCLLGGLNCFCAKVWFRGCRVVLVRLDEAVCPKWPKWKIFVKKKKKKKKVFIPLDNSTKSTTMIPMPTK